MFAIQNIESINQKLINIIQNTPLEIMNTIPVGFNNNIAWHFGHIATSCYSLAFKASGVDVNFEIPYIDKYKKGGKPEGEITQAELNELIALLNTFPEAIELAKKTNRFDNFNEYTTGTFGTTNTNIDEMLFTIALHNTLHWQSIKDYKRMLEDK